MAGFLAPQIGDISAAPIQTSASGDTSVGNALSSIAGLINLVGKSGGVAPPKDTQTDRDDEALRPIFSKFNRLLEMRKSGALSPGQFTAKSNALTGESISAFPHLRQTITEGFSVLAGEPIGVVEQTPQAQVKAVRDEWFANTAIGQASLVLAVAEGRNPETGEIDSKRIDLALDRIYAENIFGEAARLEARNNVEEAKASAEFTNIKQAAFIDPLLQSQQATVSQIISAHITSFLSDTTGASDDAQRALVGLRTIESQWRSLLIGEAAEVGVLDEAEYRAGLEVVMSQFESQISFLEGLVDNEAALLTIKKNRNQSAMIDLVNRMGLPSTPAIDSVVATFLLENKLVKVKDVARAFEGFNVPGVAINDTASDPTTTEPLYRPRFEEDAAALPQELQIEDVETGVTLWKQGKFVNDAGFAEEQVRARFVDGLARAIGVMNVTGDPISESTFDRVYDPGFVTQYKRITRFDDETSGVLKNIVKRHLGITLDRRITFTEATLRNKFSETLPGLSLKFNGTNYVLDFGTGRGSTAQERSLLEALDRAKLPRTLSGLKDLVTEDAFNVVFEQLNIGLFSGGNALQNIEKEIDYLNKIVGTIKLFPEFSSEALPASVGEKTPETEVPIISTGEEFMALPDGANFLIDIDGVLVSRVKE